MAQVVFYEKPGCINNARQKQLLRKAGHTVISKNLLTENWAGNPAQLTEFFGDKPVSEWFNRSAPAIKSGQIDPDSVTAQQAIALMIAEPLLIRRPLLQVDDRKTVGFDEQFLELWIGLNTMRSDTDLQTCPNTRSLGCNND